MIRGARYACLSVGVLLAGCGSSQVLATPASDQVAAASCVGLSPAAQFAAARVVFVGQMLPGPSTPVNGRPVLTSPARVRVARYLKGTGPRTVGVDTAVKLTRRGILNVEDGIEPHAGERWKIYTGSRRQPFATSICAGSARVRSR
jgi:hypothetical protein